MKYLKESICKIIWMNLQIYSSIFFYQKNNIPIYTYFPQTFNFNNLINCEILRKQYIRYLYFIPSPYQLLALCPLHFFIYINSYTHIYIHVYTYIHVYLSLYLCFVLLNLLKAITHFTCIQFRMHLLRIGHCSRKSQHYFHA